jgi:hypothetical protein
MATLGEDLASTIRNLEHIRDAQNPPNQDVIHQINDLYDLTLDYASAQIDQGSTAYANAAQAMSDAAQASLSAINNLAQVAKTVQIVATAISLLTKLLAAV